jgi:tRNA threonylcarbamoyladenosine biosynthesis protein TsaB
MSPEFNCIAIETATEHCSVAACAGDRVEITRLADHRSSSRHLYEAIGQAIARAGFAPAALDCVAFGCGPGSFTGLRIAAAAAQGIAYALSIPVCRVSSLAATAVSARAVADSLPVAVCIDARQGEVYLGLYGWDPAGEPVALRPDALLRPEQVLFDAAHGAVLAAGNGWSAWPAMQTRNAAAIREVLPDVWPDAAGVLEIARHQFSKQQFVAPAGALPNYVRNKVTD